MLRFRCAMPWNAEIGNWPALWKREAKECRGRRPFDGWVLGSAARELAIWKRQRARNARSHYCAILLRVRVNIGRIRSKCNGVKLPRGFQKRAASRPTQ